MARRSCARAGVAARREYDLAINFEPDIRSNLLLALSGRAATCRVLSGGGGAVLTDAVAPDPRAHIADNAKALVERAFVTGNQAACTALAAPSLGRLPAS